MNKIELIPSIDADKLPKHIRRDFAQQNIATSFKGESLSYVDYEEALDNGLIDALKLIK